MTVSMTIRWRLTLWNALGFAAVLVGFASLVYVLLSRALAQQTERTADAGFRLMDTDPKLSGNPDARARYWVREFDEHMGVLAGVYLAEYSGQSKTAELTRFVTDIMLSAPSIVLGLFVYAIAVATVGNFSGWAGSLALSLIAVPVVVRTTENMLRLVPGSLREAAFALGAPRWKVSTMVTLRAARSGVMTGLLLAVARISGETAPLLFTALNNQFFSTNMNAPMANLPVVIFQFALSPYENWVRLAWGGALLITLSVLILNVVARAFLREKSRA